MRTRPWPSRDDCLAAFRQGDGKGVGIAVLDTGVDGSHQDLAGMTLQSSWGFEIVQGGLSEIPSTASDESGHGTAIAGIIHRLAPGAEIISIRVLDAAIRQQRHELIRRGAFTAARLGAKILNCSFGVPGTVASLCTHMDWSDEMLRQGRLVVGACSNDSDDTPEWPSHLASAIGITAGDCAPEETLFRPGQVIPFAAAGCGIEVPVPGGGYRTVTGSSFAAAHISGMLARLLSVFPTLSPAMAREALEHYSAPFPEK